MTQPAGQPAGQPGGQSVEGPGAESRSARWRLPADSGPQAADLVLGGRPLPLAGTMRAYTCGITPYDVTHLGHAATFVWADLLGSLARSLRVRTVVSRNVTDVDDVLTRAADARNRLPDELAVTAEFAFDRDMADLGVARPDASPRARAHVDQVVQLVRALAASGAAYEVDGTVFFAAPEDLDRGGYDEDRARAAFAEFGDAGDDGRRAPWDVPVWKASGEREPAWPSPWGWGRPAWHVECAAMAATVFGASVDVLVGGADLCFPHHAYQRAMVEAAFGTRPFARRTMHVGTVRHRGAKMAKSTGNLVLVRDLLQERSGPAVRLLLLDRPWAESWEYDASAWPRVEERLDAVYAAAGRPGEEGGADRVTAALLDDLDVPRAVDVAVESEGPAARRLLDVLRLR